MRAVADTDFLSAVIKINHVDTIYEDYKKEAKKWVILY